MIHADSCSFLDERLRFCPAGLADDQFGAQQNLPGIEIRVLDSLEHCLHGSVGDLAAGLAHGCQGDGKQGCVANIIEPDDAKIAREANAQLRQRLNDLRGRAIVGTDDRIGGGFMQQPADQFRIGRVADFDPAFLR